MKLSGVIPLRNAVKLGYPFVLAIRSLQHLCDEVVVLVDPSSEDDTLTKVKELGPDKIVESVWNMSNHDGHKNCEITVQTAKVCAAAAGDWVMSLQADEVLHEDEAASVREAIVTAAHAGVTGLELLRPYFYGGLDRLRTDWSLWLLRLFRRGWWKPDVDGAMRFDPVHPGEPRIKIAAKIYHYSRVGEPEVVAERVRNLDGFFHVPEKVQSGPIPPYDFTKLRKLDTYVVGAPLETAPDTNLVAFAVEDHPKSVREYFKCAL